MKILVGVAILLVTICGFQAVLLLKTPLEPGLGRSGVISSIAEDALISAYPESASVVQAAELSPSSADDHLAGQAAEASPKRPPHSLYQVVGRIALPGSEPWNQLVADPETGRLYVTRDTHVMVIDPASGHVVGDIPDTDGVYGVALAPHLDRGFTTNARANTVTIFDLKTLATIATVAIPGKNPHHIVFDPKSRLVFVMNSRSQSITAINPLEGKIVANIPLVDNPASAAVDGKGRLYVNLGDPAEIAVIDTDKLALIDRIPLAPCIEPHGLAIDLSSHRLFAGCGNGLLMVVDPDHRKVVAKLTTDPHTHDVVLDPEAGYVFAAHPSGTATVLRESFPDKYSVRETLRTRRGSKRIAVDPRSHRVYIPTARFQDRLGKEELRIVPNSLVILVLGSPH